MKLNWSRIIGSIVLSTQVLAHTEADEKLTDDDLSLPDLAQVETLKAPSELITKLWAPRKSVLTSIRLENYWFKQI